MAPGASQKRKAKSIDGKRPRRSVESKTVVPFNDAIATESFTPPSKVRACNYYVFMFRWHFESGRLDFSGLSACSPKLWRSSACSPCSSSSPLRAWPVVSATASSRRPRKMRCVCHDP